MAAAKFTENVILRDDASGLVVGFVAGDTVPEWAEGLTTHTTAAAAKPADADKGDDSAQSDEDAANEQAADDADADKGDAKPATRSRTAKK